MKTKTFDCVEMKRKAAMRIQEDSANLTPEQKIEHWRRRSEELRAEQDELVRTAAASARRGTDDERLT